MNNTWLSAAFVFYHLRTAFLAPFHTHQQMAANLNVMFKVRLPFHSIPSGLLICLKEHPLFTLPRSVIGSGEHRNALLDYSSTARVSSPFARPLYHILYYPWGPYYSVFPHYSCSIVLHGPSILHTCQYCLHKLSEVRDQIPPFFFLI